MTRATELHRPRVRGRRDGWLGALISGPKTSTRIPLPFVRLTGTMLRHASRDTIPQRRRAGCGARANRRPRHRQARHSRPSCDRRSPAAGSRRTAGAVSRRARRSIESGTASAWNRAALHAPGGSDRACAGRPACRGHHADGIGQDALLQRAGARCDPQGPVEPRALPVPDQGARAGSARRTAGDVRADRPRDRREDRRVHLRWRHTAGRAADHPVARAPGAQQPRHAALRNPSAPSAVGEIVREPALRDHRRAARVPRRVRQPLVQRPSPPSPHLPSLRFEPGLSVLLGDDSESARAGGAPHRAIVRAGRQERRPTRGEVLRLREPAGGQPAARYPALVSCRDTPRGGRVPQAKPPAHRLRSEPSFD